ncbi:MAG: hypothetical protein Kow0077_08600 [Anaerolineae bacterium]
MNKRLTRSRKNRVLGGVAAGLADALDLDVALVRLLFVALALTDGVGLLLYVAMWLVVPEENSRRITG